MRVHGGIGAGTPVYMCIYIYVKKDEWWRKFGSLCTKKLLILIGFGSQTLALQKGAKNSEAEIVCL